MIKEYFQLLIENYTFQIISLGTALTGFLSGVLGSFAILKRQSLLGDAIAHASLPGIAIAFLIIEVKNNNVFLLGALIMGVLAGFFIKGIISNTHLKSDAAMGIVLSTFFGFGMLLLSYIQKLPNANQSGLENYLFGQSATLMKDDILMMSIITLISLVIIYSFWKEFKVVLFDIEYAKTLGFRVNFIDMLITLLIVISIIMGLQTVGVILISAMLLAPAAAARQWTNNLSKMILLSGFLGALSGIIGTAISASKNDLPTGPVIVLVANFFVLISFIFSPIRGLLLMKVRLWRNRNNLQLMKTLCFMYNLVKTHKDISHLHKIQLLNNFQGYTRKRLKKLESKGLILLDKNYWSLTKKGFDLAKDLYLSTK